jgi:hypothetical protein
MFFIVFLFLLSSPASAMCGKDKSRGELCFKGKCKALQAVFTCQETQFSFWEYKTGEVVNFQLIPSATDGAVRLTIRKKEKIIFDGLGFLRNNNSQIKAGDYLYKF